MNDVILIGGSHHNGLGLVRSFGKFGINPYGVIIGRDAEKSFVRKSKHWKKTFCIESENELVQLLLKKLRRDEEKPIIIPWSDGAALELDANYNKLSQNFILPSMGKKEGAIVKLQDKLEQIKLAEKYGIPTAKSWLIEFKRGHTTLPKDMVYPCILKPVTSVEGDKLDITKCNSKSELLEAIDTFAYKGYNRILCQEFIVFDYEFEFCGSCSSDPAYMISKNIRNWPVVGGTNSFFQCIVDSTTDKICQSILNALENEGFQGLFDIEMFRKGDRFLLNEFNWRNTGNSFFAHGTGVHYAVVWYYAMSGCPEKAKEIKHKCIDPNQCAMNESTDLRHVFYRGLSFHEWYYDFRRTQSFALWFRGDLKPTLRQYLHLAYVLLTGKKR